MSSYLDRPTRELEEIDHDLRLVIERATATLRYHESGAEIARQVIEVAETRRDTIRVALEHRDRDPVVVPIDWLSMAREIVE